MASDVKYFDIDDFESQWAASTERQKANMVKASVQLAPSQGIRPMLTGYFSGHAMVQVTSRAALETLADRIRGLVADPGQKERYESGLLESARVSAAVYAGLWEKIRPRQRDFLFRALIRMGGKGPAAAFTAMVRGHIPEKERAGALKPLADRERLDLADEYIQSNPGLRLTFGPLFKSLLNSVKSRSGVIAFYASLFDRNLDADPFLHNIRPELRDPKQILAKEMASQKPETRLLGIKALSMLVNQVPSGRMASLLTLDEPEQIRLAVYRIIENAPPGGYADLFDPVLALMPELRGLEALNAFNALAASGRHPLFRLIDIIHERFPFLLPAIKNEISSLSKTSFLFIQDMALNPDRYSSGIHFDINQACIFGMVKKRPERVAAIFQKVLRNPRVKSPPQLIQFVRTVKGLFEKEKKDITAAFTPAMIKKAQKNGNRRGSRLDSGPADLSGHDFSGKDIRPSDLVFREAIIEKGDFTGASFKHSDFNRAVIVDTDMQNAVFDSVSFDQSTWINVKAASAVFKNCSFDRVQIFNTDFGHAVIKDCFFTEALISATAFKAADISFSSFAFARLSGVILDEARTTLTDFSRVRARFSRFPQKSLGTSRTDGILYNFRKFQPQLSDLPVVDRRLVREINMLIFCEFTHYGEEKFLRQNKRSLLTALDIFSPVQAHFFQIIPVLIHENIDIPGMDPIPDQTPCGIFGYLPPADTLHLSSAYTGGLPLRTVMNPAPAVLGLYTIGSVGSVAQTRGSDIDYWVCIEEAALTPYEITLLKNKLAMLEKLAADKFHTQVTFFLVDISRVRENDFGDSTIESSGSAQAGLLKEEFYRTMIHLAGRIPLWAVLPTAISRQYHEAIARRITASAPQDRYLDLGDIHEIPNEEYFGASIWQMFKWIKSPFKSILKMALLEKYFFEPGGSPLLCNQYKNEWMNTGTCLKLAQNDAYYFLVKHLVAFYRVQKDDRSVNLLLTCFFLKLGISDSRELDQTPTGLRKILVLKCLDTWGWDLRRMLKVGNINAWPYKNIVRLSQTLEAYILRKYKKVKACFDQAGTLDALISSEDRTVLEHKVKIEFSRQPNKVRKILLVSRGERHFRRLYLKCQGTAPPGGDWVLLNHPDRSDMEDELIYQASTIEEIGAWLVVNGLYSGTTRIRLLSSPFSFTEEEVNDLFQNLLEFFSPLLKAPVDFEQLLVYPEKHAVFAAMNFYAKKNTRAIFHYTCLYINGWNEIFCRTGYSAQGFMSMAHVKRDMMFKLRMRKLPDQTAFYFPRPPA